MPLEGVVQNLSLQNFGGVKDHLRISASFQINGFSGQSTVPIQGMNFTGVYNVIDISSLQGVQNITKIAAIQFSFVAEYLAAQAEAAPQLFIVVDDIEVFCITLPGPQVGHVAASAASKSGVLAVDSNTPPKTVKLLVVNGVSANMNLSLFINLFNFEVKPFIG
jgi:hypothetical protein